MALDDDVDVVGDIQLNTSNKRAHIYLLIFTDDSLAQVQTYAAEKSIETGTMERFATIGIGIGTEACGATDALALLANGNGALEPLRRVVIEIVNYEFETYIEQEKRTKILGPGPLKIQMKYSPHVSQFQQGCHDENKTDDCSSCHNVQFLVRHIRAARFIFRVQSSRQTPIPTSFWDIQQGFVMNGGHFGIIGKIVTNVLRLLRKTINFADRMSQGQKETITTRIISTIFTVLALAIFKPFGLDAWQWMAYVHLLVIGVLGFGCCLVTEGILKYFLHKPRSFHQGVDYIIKRNLWFQLINTPLVALSICLYRHFAMSDLVAGNVLSWSNFFETLLIIAFCSFAIGLYWRFKFRSRYLAAELEETRQLNERLRQLQEKTEQRARAAESALASEPDVAEPTAELADQPSSIVTLTGTTSETVTLQVHDLLYVEAVGNYVKVYQTRDGQVHNDMLRATSKQIEEELSAYPMIVRCHRAFLVNLGQVEEIISKSGTMQLLMKHCHDSIPVSRSNMVQVKEAIKGKTD